MDDTRSARRLTALVDAGLALAAELDLDTLLTKIADLARSVIGATYAAVGVLDDDGDLVAFHHSGIDEETVKRIGALPEGRGVLGALIEEGRPLRLTEIKDHPRSHGFPPHHPDMHTFLGVPIMARGNIFGRLYLTEKRDASEFSKDDERMAMLFAAQAGVAVENARLYGQVERLNAALRDLAILEERERISKELHDGVIQSIYSVGLSLQGSVALMARDPAAAKARIDKTISMLDDLIRDIRGYIFELQPKVVEEVGLSEAIRGMVRELEVNSLASAHVDLGDEDYGGLGSQEQSHIVQIVREVLSNIARHAQATQVWVEFRRGPDKMVLRIEDDGLGFDVSAVTRGLGLTNIQDRAARLGGSIVFLPREPSGTIHLLTIGMGEGEVAHGG